ncbi:MAG: ribbon-helix-helix domain-containing protein [Fimbriimonadales bacterium]|nr:ribbon-helix-helix domain-containing protein [Fimbriimonadales bacterium]
MRQITLEVPDELYEACLQIAKRTGRSVEWCIIEALARHNPYALPELSPEQAQRAIDALQPFVGIAQTGNPRSADNEAIEADLAHSE